MALYTLITVNCFKILTRLKTTKNSVLRMTIDQQRPNKSVQDDKQTKLRNCFSGQNGERVIHGVKYDVILPILFH